MANRHCVEYSRTGRAKCISPTCNEVILKGGLRFGTLVPNPFDPTTEVFRFYHWECTPTVVVQMLKDIKLEAVAEWNNLQPDDKKRLKDDIARVASAPAHGATSSNSVTPSQNSTQPRDSLSLRTSVVGTQYWQKATVSRGEKVRIVRTPKNKFDNNACNVATAAGDIFGSVPHGLCAQISPLLDRKEGDFTVEGTMLEGHAEKAKVYELAMELKLTFPLVPAVRNAIPLALVHAALQYGSTAPVVEQHQAVKRARAADDSSDEEPLHKRQRQGPASSVDATLPAEKESPRKRPHVPLDIWDKLNRVRESTASPPSREPMAVDAHGQIIYG
ncbi:hypothetical protein EXIGLDRAFT_449476 [Exidia glandulosa HHB12029]|uniref:PARP-type domain-containing protein n=1 Tax=Exidia glandulosa HHB12029 TaxID=1314781 RepID=A0A165K8A7_EXIGL|nr:hypothetical protein EXIGLDRAFT_449476 [Exidia glandulosa HHB12029]